MIPPRTEGKPFTWVEIKEILSLTAWAIGAIAFVWIMLVLLHAI